MNRDESNIFIIKIIDKTKTYILKILLISILKYFLFKNVIIKKNKNSTAIKITFCGSVKTIIL